MLQKTGLLKNYGLCICGKIIIIYVDVITFVVVYICVGVGTFVGPHVIM
jgi:hypothetical protein